MNEKKNIATKETFALAVQNHQKNNLEVAEKLYKEILNSTGCRLEDKICDLREITGSNIISFIPIYLL